MDYWEKMHTEHAIQNGYYNLLECYMQEGNRLLDIWSIDFNDNSVVVCLKMPDGDRAWNVFSVWPSKSSKEKGLWLGYCNQNYRKLFSADFPQGALPEDFEGKSTMQHDKEWCFGYIKSKEQIDELMIACDRD